MEPREAVFRDSGRPAYHIRTGQRARKATNVSEFIISNWNSCPKLTIKKPTTQLAFLIATHRLQPTKPTPPSLPHIWPQAPQPLTCTSYPFISPFPLLIPDHPRPSIRRNRGLPTDREFCTACHTVNSSNGHLEPKIHIRVPPA